MRRSVLAILFVLLAWPVAAQQFTPTQSCQTKVFPDQGATFKTRVTVPPSVVGQDLTYPVIYTVPAHATSVGLEFWTHRFLPGPPKDSVHIHNYQILPGGETNAARQRLTFAANNKGPAEDGIWTSFALSTVLHPGESVVVGVWNGNPYPIEIDIAVTLRECVALPAVIS